MRQVLGRGGGGYIDPDLAPWETRLGDIYGQVRDVCDVRLPQVAGPGPRMVAAGEGGGNYGGATGGFECGKCWAEAEAATNIQSMYRARQNQTEFLEGTRKYQYCANLGRLCEGRIVDELLEDHYDVELHDFTVGDGSLKERATAFAKAIFADRDQTGRGK